MILDRHCQLHHLHLLAGSNVIVVKASGPLLKQLGRGHVFFSSKQRTPVEQDQKNVSIIARRPEKRGLTVEASLLLVGLPLFLILALNVLILHKTTATLVSHFGFRRWETTLGWSDNARTQPRTSTAPLRSSWTWTITAAGGQRQLINRSLHELVITSPKENKYTTNFSPVTSPTTANIGRRRSRRWPGTWPRSGPIPMRETIASCHRDPTSLMDRSRWRLTYREGCPCHWRLLKILCQRFTINTAIDKITFWLTNDQR